MIKFCSLYSGSSGNAIFLRTGKTKLLIDAGLSARKIIEALYSIGENPSEINAVLISHEHADHIKGAGVISRKFNIPIYANELTWKAMEREIGPVSPVNKVFFQTGTDFEIRGICVRAFSIPHDASDPVGFNFLIENKKITTATDIGHINKELLTSLEGSDLLLIESNHDLDMLMVGNYPWVLKRRIMSDTGHLSNIMAARAIAYLAEKGMRRFVLGHLSKENNFPELAYQTSYSALKERNIHPEKDVMLEIATRDRISRVVHV